MLKFWVKLENFLLCLLLFGVIPLTPILSRLFCNHTILERDAHLAIAMYSFLHAFTASHKLSFGLGITIAILASFSYANVGYEVFAKFSFSFFLFIIVFIILAIERFIQHYMKEEPCLRIF